MIRTCVVPCPRGDEYGETQLQVTYDVTEDDLIILNIMGRETGYDLMEEYEVNGEVLDLLVLDCAHLFPA